MQRCARDLFFFPFTLLTITGSHRFSTQTRRSTDDSSCSCGCRRHQRGRQQRQRQRHYHHLPPLSKTSTYARFRGWSLFATTTFCHGTTTPENDHHHLLYTRRVKTRPPRETTPPRRHHTMPPHDATSRPKRPTRRHEKDDHNGSKAGRTRRDHKGRPKGPKEHRRSNSGTYKVLPLLFFN